MSAPEPLDEHEIAARLAQLPGWVRDGGTICRTFAHTYHECIHLAAYVAAKAREVGHHPDIHITWQRIMFAVTTHDAGDTLTAADFDLASHIDAIAKAGGAKPVLSEAVVPTPGYAKRCPAAWERSGASSCPGQRRRHQVKVMLHRGARRVVQVIPVIHLVPEIPGASPVPRERHPVQDRNGQAGRIEQSWEPPGRVRDRAHQA